MLDGTLHAGQAGLLVPGGADANGKPSTYRIDESYGHFEGDNLFHSFERFDVPGGETATFTGPSAPRHVIARVTGGDASDIAGTLRSTYTNADLYLVNPAGVTFGAGAQIDVPGALHVSTANYVKLGADGRFDAADPSRDALSIAPPAAFGFLGAPAGVTVAAGSKPVRHGSPIDAERSALSIVAGDVAVDGRLVSYGGDLSIVSVGGPGEVPIDAQGPLQPPATGTVRVTGVLSAQRDDRSDLVIRAGRLEVDGGTVAARVRSDEVDTGGVDVRAADVVLVDRGSIETSNNGHGTAPAIAIDAARVVIGASDGRASRIDGSAIGPGRGAAIDVRASESVKIRTGNDGGGIFSTAWDDGDGDGGTIAIETPSFEMGDFSQISVATRDVGAAGSIAITADRVDVSGGAQLCAGAKDDGHGAAGSVAITARDTVRFAGRVQSGDLPFFERASGIVVSAADEGGGTVHIAANRLVIDDAEIEAHARGAGDGTDVSLDVGTLDLTHGAFIDATTDGAGRGGDVAIRASEHVSVSGVNRPPAPEGCQQGCPTTAHVSTITSSTTGPGDAGTIRIEAPLLHLFDEGSVAAYTAENPAGSGNQDPDTIPGLGGAIEIEVGDLLLESNGLIQTSTTWAGHAGSISVHASHAVEIRDASRDPHDVDESEAGLQSRTYSTGNAGRITVETPLLHIAGGMIETSATFLPPEIAVFPPAIGAGGDVELHVGRLVLDGWGRVRSVAEAAGDAGRIHVSASESVSIEGPGAFGVVPGISTGASAGGNGGSIEVAAPSIRIAYGGEITARSTGSGDAGQVSIRGDSLVMDRGTIATSATSADGGNVLLTLRDALQMIDSEISASVENGQGGNVTIDPDFVLLERSRILAQAAAGRGGAIRIVADLFFAEDSVVSASAGPAGLSGTVEIVSPDADLASELEALPATFLDASALLRERCAARSGARASLYVVEAPAAPRAADGWLSSRREGVRSASPATAARAPMVFSCPG